MADDPTQDDTDRPRADPAPGADGGAQDGPDRAGESAAQAPATAATTPRPTMKSRRRDRRTRRADAASRPRVPVLRLVLSLLFAGTVVLYVALQRTGRVIVLPELAREAVETRVNAALPSGAVALGRLGLAIGRDGAPRAVLDDLRLRDARGGGAARLSRVTSRLSPRALITGGVELSQLNVTGGEIVVRRDTAGRFTLSSGGGGPAPSLTDVVTGLDTGFSLPLLSRLSEIQVQNVVVAIEDARTGRIWQATNARGTIRRGDGRISVTLASDVFNGTEDLAEVQLSAATWVSTGETTLQVRLGNVPARDLALQGAALAWLAPLQAPISGAVRVIVAGDGTLDTVAGTLEIGAGVLRPTPEAQPLAFDSARAYFDSDLPNNRLRFTEISTVGEAGRISATGTVEIEPGTGLLPAGFVGQFEVSDAQWAAQDTLGDPVNISGARADLRLRLDPFSVDIPQIVLNSGGDRLRASARIGADATGWQVALDATAETLGVARLLSLWPETMIKGVRGWLGRNLQDGGLKNVTLAVRRSGTDRPKVGLSFGFEDTTLRYLKELPPITDGHGFAQFGAGRFALDLNRGTVVGPSGAALDIAGTTMVIDSRVKPSEAALALQLDGPLGDVLALLDRPPMRVMERAKRSADIVDGRLTGRADITFPIRPKLGYDAVGFDVVATARDVTSDRLIEGRSLAADALTLRVTPTLISLDGPARLDGVPLTASWRQPIGAEVAPGRVTGDVVLSPEVLATFGVRLPRELFRGRTTADYTLDFPPGDPPRLNLTSDLRGARMGLSALSWSKGPGTAGSLTLDVDLGARPDVPRLILQAPGLLADGRIALSASGSLQAATFRRVRLGQVLDAPITIRPGPTASRPDIQVRGGTFDLRRARFGGSGGGGAGPRIAFALERFQISDGIALSPVEGVLNSGAAGLEGRFTGSVNGRAPVEGSLVPFRGRTAIRLRGNDAGAVVRAAGLSENTYGGALNLTLTPAAAGGYDGAFDMTSVRIRKAPALADLLDAISVVGILDQLEGPGILFSNVDGRFQLTSDRLVLQRMAATGGSLGVSLDGTYDLNTRALAMGGVISPIYFLNGIGQIFTRRGEGLFGFAYRLDGTAQAPVISVNPLSILTPAMFREIFRRPPPQ